MLSTSEDNGEMSCCRETFRVWIPILCLFLGFSAFAEGTRQGWPHIRGPHYDGRSAETGLADQWPTQGPPVLWTKELGQGYSGFVIADDRAYTQYQTLTGQFVLCLDAETGETIWRYRYDWAFQPTGLYPGPRSTPTIADDHVFFTTPSGAVSCLSIEGKLVWSRDLTAELSGKGTEFGYACSPTVIDGKVILPIGAVGGSMVALDQNDGTIVWKSGDEPASYTPALPITIDGQSQVIGYLENDLVGYDLKTGERLWSEHLSNGYDEHSAWPIYDEPYLWTSAPFQAGSQLWKLSGRSAEGSGDADCNTVWQSPLMSNDVSSSVLVDGYLYGFDVAEAQSKAHRPTRGCFRCLDFLTGKQQWANGIAKTRRKTDFESNRNAEVVGHASVIEADGKLFLLNDLGDLILAEANPVQYIERGRVRVLGGEISWTAPALDQGRLFVRNHGRAVCLFVGEPNTQTSTNWTTAAEIPQGEVRDYSLLLGVEPEYAMDPPTYRWLWNWYVGGVAILCVAGLIAAVTPVLFRQRATADQCRVVFVAVAVLLGIVAGTPASIATGDFVFTWPVALFALFAIAIQRSELRRPLRSPLDGTRKQTNLISRSSFAVFLIACVIYFVACRQMSLVTQWFFLWGFWAAAPALVVTRYWQSRTGWHSRVIEWVMIQIAFGLFFGSTAALLDYRYDLVWS
ncbi:PQQ-binding-like beta-propeller repeat protein [Novipirellula sp.]|uniref:PQQ-binding-like beta-propeller repeat protein n=1 Tax=Novipirellula sp. TaxID=2795430 RepID=UPI00356850CD